MLDGKHLEGTQYPNGWQRWKDTQEAQGRPDCPSGHAELIHLTEVPEARLQAPPGTLLGFSLLWDDTLVHCKDLSLVLV